MNYLSLSLIKANSRIDGTTEDSLLEFYGNSAEATIANLIGRTYANILEEYGGSVPYDIIHAGLMLVDLSYKERTAVSPATMNNVPFSISCKLMPYVKIADDSEDEETPEGVLLDVPYTAGATLTLDWSAYSFDGVKNILDAGKIVAARCTKDGSAQNTFYLWPEGVETGNIPTFSGWFLGIYKVMATLQRNTEAETGPGDIACSVTINQVIEP